MIAHSAFANGSKQGALELHVKPGADLAGDLAIGGAGAQSMRERTNTASFDSAFGTAEVQELLMRRRMSTEQMLGLELGAIIGRGSFGSVYQGEQSHKPSA